MSSTSSSSVDHGTLTRAEVLYTDKSQRFALKNRNFHRQYAHIYAVRLWALRSKLENAAKKKWGSDVLIRRLSELQLDENCVIIGTLYKTMELKPSILKELSEQNHLTGVVPGSGRKFIDPSDQLVLEDEVQRVTLAGNVDVNAGITGTVVAVYGCEPEEHAGKFFVKEIVYPMLPEQPERPLVTTDRYVAFVSGLDIGGPADDLFARQLLVDILTGCLGDERLQKMMSQVVRVVIAGNSLSDKTQDRGAATRAKYLAKKTVVGTKDAVVTLDDLLVQLAGSIDVDLMPGEFDPTDFVLPQQPLHCCMLPQSTALETMHCVTNPYDFDIDGLRVLGTSGQPVSDIVRFTSGMDDYLDVLERTLVGCHLAPTAPDTIGCYPFTETDPFVIEECPHIFFTGNAPSFGCRVHQGSEGQKVLLLTVPRFSETNSFVIVNLRSLECLQFAVGASFPKLEAISLNGDERMDVS